MIRVSEALSSTYSFFLINTLFKSATGLFKRFYANFLTVKFTVTNFCSVSLPGLPDGTFSNKKSKFGQNDRLVHFAFIWYIFPVLLSCNKKNLATLIFNSSPKTAAW
jgi:hypothetical protein